MGIRETPWQPGVPCWAELAAPDVPAAGAFYAAVLGWEIGDPVSPAGYVMPRVGGGAVAGIAPADAPGGWTLYFASDDADATAAEVTAQGGTIVVEPHDVGPLGRSFVATDPGGARFGAWQAGAHVGAQVVNVPGGLAWEDLRSPEPEAARAFYGRVLGVETTPLPEAGPDYATFGLPGQEAPLGGIGPLDGGTGAHWVVYFGVPDAAVAAAAAEAGGGAVRDRDFESPYGRMATLTDPDGALFRVIEVAPDNAGSGLPERS